MHSLFPDSRLALAIDHTAVGISSSRVYKGDQTRAGGGVAHLLLSACTNIAMLLITENLLFCGRMVVPVCLRELLLLSPMYHVQNWKGVSALCRDFIDKCLEKNPKKRITAKQAQSHPWIKKAAKEMDLAPLSKDAMLSLVKFQEKNLFEQVALELVAYSYEPSQIKELEQRFREVRREQI